MKTCIFFLNSVALFLLAQCQLQAGFNITTVASLGSQTDTQATINVSVYGLFDGVSTSNGDSLNTFGLTATINGVTPTISSPLVAPSPSQWAAFTTRPAPATTANTVTFQSNNSTTTEPINLTLTANTVGATTLIGTFSFTVTKTTSPQPFSITTSAATAPNAGASGSFFYSTGFFQGIQTTYNFNASAGAGVITAVPEPSSMALLSLAAGGLFLRRRRAANAKA